MRAPNCPPGRLPIAPLVLVSLILIGTGCPDSAPPDSVAVLDSLGESGRQERLGPDSSVFDTAPDQTALTDQIAAQDSQPLPPGCCLYDGDCPVTRICVGGQPGKAGICQAPAGAGHCWNPAHCPPGQECVALVVCGCQEGCAPKVGVCAYESD